VKTSWKFTFSDHRTFSCHMSICDLCH